MSKEKDTIYFHDDLEVSEHEGTTIYYGSFSIFFEINGCQYEIIVHYKDSREEDESEITGFDVNGFEDDKTCKTLEEVLDLFEKEYDITVVNAIADRLTLIFDKKDIFYD